MEHTLVGEPVLNYGDRLWVEETGQTWGDYKAFNACWYSLQDDKVRKFEFIHCPKKISQNEYLVSGDITHLALNKVREYMGRKQMFFFRFLKYVIGNGKIL